MLANPVFNIYAVDVDTWKEFKDLNVRIGLVSQQKGMWDINPRERGMKWKVTKRNPCDKNSSVQVIGWFTEEPWKISKDKGRSIVEEARSYAYEQCGDIFNIFNGIRVIVVNKDPSTFKNTGVLYSNSYIHASYANGKKLSDYNDNRLRQALEIHQRPAKQAAEKKRKQEKQRLAGLKKKRVKEAEKRGRLEWEKKMNVLLEGDGVIENIADVIEHNKIKALAELSAGRVIRFLFSDIEYSTGEISAKTVYRPTDVLKDSVKGFTGWEDWIKLTQGRNIYNMRYTMTCEFRDIGSVSSIKEGDLILVRAKLVRYARRSGVLRCSKLSAEEKNRL